MGGKASGTSATSEQELLERLDQLEGELSRLRKELGQRDPGLWVPEEDFLALLFEVGEASYALPLGSVREIVRYVRLTPIADVPEAVVGAINVRGEVLPVVDARRRLGHSLARPNLRTSIVLLRAEETSFGFVVDAVDIVFPVERQDVSRPSGNLARSACVSGVVTVGGRVVQLLDISRVLSVHQWATVQNRLAESTAPDSPKAREESASGAKKREGGKGKW